MVFRHLLRLSSRILQERDDPVQTTTVTTSTSRKVCFVACSLCVSLSLSLARASTCVRDLSLFLCLCAYIFVCMCVCVCVCVCVFVPESIIRMCVRVCVSALLLSHKQVSSSTSNKESFNQDQKMIKDRVDPSVSKLGPMVSISEKSKWIPKSKR